ncbi:oligoribonuclease [Pseudomonas sp. P66]|uniref:Oligoribonuclease n=1 Tax=Pseudomonas arcuscaelestis TaxID=2710591 RepID=A0ABS2BYC9_9PSED|nr:oligoribonuclease [Pseudomonas arcuscaelestis]MBM5458624.1 oligoribonuclease [Pseudomonas arcuscaelestis]
MLPPPRRLPWLDLETTGFTQLHERMVYKHRILEIGALVTDEHFNVVASFSAVIQQPIDVVMKLSDEVVVQMHTQNGLFDEVAQSTMTLEAAERELIHFYRSNGVPDMAAPLCGSGIHFDRMFVEAQMPALNDFLFYRNLDVSAVKEFLKLISPSFEPAKRKSHRALDDIHESVTEASAYRDLLGPLLATLHNKAPTA